MAEQTNSLPPLKLSEASEPKLILEMPDGTKREFDPWEIGEKIENGMREAVDAKNATLSRTFDIVRKAVGLPTQQEVDDSKDDPKPVTLSRNACMKLQAAVNRFMEEFEQTKK